MRRARDRGFAVPLALDSPELRVESRKRTLLSRLSAPGRGRLCGEQARQPAQIGRQHRQREYMAHPGQSAKLDLADGAAVLFAITKQGLDHLPNDLAHGISVVSRGAGVDPTFPLGAFACLGVVLVRVLRPMGRDLELAAVSDKLCGVVVFVCADGLRCSPGRLETDVALSSTLVWPAQGRARGCAMIAGDLGKRLGRDAGQLHVDCVHRQIASAVRCSRVCDGRCRLLQLRCDPRLQ